MFIPESEIVNADSFLTTCIQTFSSGPDQADEVGQLSASDGVADDADEAVRDGSAYKRLSAKYQLPKTED